MCTPAHLRSIMTFPMRDAHCSPVVSVGVADPPTEVLLHFLGSLASEPMTSPSPDNSNGEEL